MGHMADLNKELDKLLTPRTTLPRPKMRGSIMPPKMPVMTPKVKPEPKESKYKFL
jgi:hypothetical protein